MDGKGIFWLRQGALFAVSCILMAAMAWGVHTYVLGIYLATSDGLSPMARKGQRFYVNKLHRDSIRRGDLLVFSADSAYLGVVVHVPGDIIGTDSSGLTLPDRCCPWCEGRGCRPYIVNTGQGMAWVTEADVVGHARRFWPLR